MPQIATKFKPEAASFQLAFDCGFRAAELWLDETLLLEAERVVELADRFPFRYAIHFPNELNVGPEAVERAAWLYARLDCSALVIHEPQFLKYADTILRHRPETRLAVENHFHQPDEFHTWCARWPGMTLDVEHLWLFCLGQEAPLSRVIDTTARFLDLFGSRLRHVHLPGFVPMYDEHRPMYCNRDLVRAVWHLLDEMRFDGLVVSEVSLPFQNAFDLRMDVLLHEGWLAERGVGASQPAVHS
jgi:hypothetical protein